MIFIQNVIINLILGQWQSVLENFDENNISSILNAFQGAIKYDGNWYKAWHSWAMANYEAISFYENNENPQFSKKINYHLIPAIKGFFRSISLSPNNK